MGNPVVHWELMSKEPQKVAAFYQRVFDWKVDHIPDINYRVVDTLAKSEMKGINGGTYAVPANKLSFSGGTLSTTMRLAGINSSADTRMNAQARLNSQGPAHASATGVAHANAHSVLAGGTSVAALSNVSVGMPLFSNGSQVGTVYRVVTANGRIARVLVQGTNGRIYSLSPSSLTASGGSLTTTVSLRGT